MRDVDDITAEIVDAALAVHRALGPGLLESAYDLVLAQVLRSRGPKVERGRDVVLEYHGMRLVGGRMDHFVEDQVPVELKSREKLELVHGMQLLTYLRLQHLPVGLLVNFGAPTLKQGLRRIVNDYHPSTSPRPPRLRVKSGA
jgi:iron complex transport system substrate-binding protein